MSRFGIVGPTYASQLLNAAAQRCVNWYPERVEVDDKSPLILLPSPGLALFGSVAGKQQGRGGWTINGRSFTVIDNNLYEFLTNGTLNALGVVANDLKPVSIVANAQQLFVASGGLGYVYMLQANGPYLAGQFVPILVATFPGPIIRVGYVDGFFIALVGSKGNSPAQYWVSNSLDATTWTANGSKIPSVFPDNVISMGIDHREIWLYGPKQTEVEYDSGNIFPFDTVPGGFVEQGCGAVNSVTNFDNALAWLGARNDMGWAIAWRTNGYSAMRISNHAIEQAWSSYSTIADSYGFSFVQNGHTFWQLNFPSGNASWRFDASTGMWHEVDFWNSTRGVFQMHRAAWHTFNFGKNLVGDTQSGAIYQMSDPVAAGSAWAFCDDFGNTIRRMRRAPHISTEQEWIYHNRLQIDFETGLGPIPSLLDGSGNARGPIASLRWSDDGGHTWSGTHDRDLGQGGEYHKRALWNRCGRSRDRVYEVTCTDPVPLRIVDAYLKATPGHTPQKRLSRQMAEVA